MVGDIVVFVSELQAGYSWYKTVGSIIGHAAGHLSFNFFVYYYIPHRHVELIGLSVSPVHPVGKIAGRRTYLVAVAFHTYCPSIAAYVFKLFSSHKACEIIRVESVLFSMAPLEAVCESIVPGCAFRR